MTQNLLVGKAEKELSIIPKMANRHGLIAGATGTGKTVTLQVLAENFSRIGVPVFMSDVKGDLSGISKPGKEHPKITERVNTIGISDFSFSANSVTFWDVFGEQGHPIRTTISEMGPLLLSRLLNLNDTQTGVLSLIFRIADDDGLLLLGAIQRKLLNLEDQGGDIFFGEPALNLDDFLQTDENGKGIINILAANKLMGSPRIYTTLLLWLLSELFEQLPEVGDPEKPKLVFFFDEAHLLFDNAPAALQEKIEQVARLIRSKGVGVFFVSQNPLDIPDEVLGQLGNRIQHALRAYTPRDQKAVKAAAQTFRTNPKLDTETVITELGVGEALISFLDEKGRPNIVEQALIRPPFSQIGPIEIRERKQIIQSSLVYGVYEKTVDRESAYEMLKKRAEQAPKATTKPKKKPGRQRQGMVETMAKSAARSIGSKIANKLMRGILGSILK
jgi:DNA helicase HerA-like ATPase